MSTSSARPYANPYLAGIDLGVVLLAAFLVAGRGLGASGAFAALASHTVAHVAPSAAENAYFQRYLQEGPAWLDWRVIQVRLSAPGASLYASSQVRAHAAWLESDTFGNPHADHDASRRSTAVVARAKAPGPRVSRG